MKVTLSNKRMCVVSRQKIETKNLLRITNINGEWKINDVPYKGRSFYLQKDKEVIKKFLNKKKTNIRNFNLNDSLKEELLEYAQNL